MPEIELQRYEGRVRRLSKISRHTVQLELDDINQVFQLFTDADWCIDRGDALILLARPDADTGKFIAKYYKNKTKNVWSAVRPSYGWYLIAFPISVVSFIILIASKYAILSLPLLLLAARYIWVNHRNNNIIRRIRENLELP
jgi:hypothetical protein